MQGRSRCWRASATGREAQGPERRRRNDGELFRSPRPWTRGHSMARHRRRIARPLERLLITGVVLGHLSFHFVIVGWFTSNRSLLEVWADVDDLSPLRLGFLDEGPVVRKPLCLHALLEPRHAWVDVGANLVRIRLDTRHRLSDDERFLGPRDGFGGLPALRVVRDDGRVADEVAVDVADLEVVDGLAAMGRPVDGVDRDAPAGGAEHLPGLEVTGRYPLAAALREEPVAPGGDEFMALLQADRDEFLREATEQARDRAAGWSARRGHLLQVEHAGPSLRVHFRELEEGPVADPQLVGIDPRGRAQKRQVERISVGVGRQQVDPHGEIWILRVAIRRVGEDGVAERNDLDRYGAVRGRHQRPGDEAADLWNAATAHAGRLAARLHGLVRAHGRARDRTERGPDGHVLPHRARVEARLEGLPHRF